jgi:hypothetical protein
MHFFYNNATSTRFGGRECIVFYNNTTSTRLGVRGWELIYATIIKPLRGLWGITFILFYNNITSARLMNGKLNQFLECITSERLNYCRK